MEFQKLEKNMSNFTLLVAYESEFLFHNHLHMLSQPASFIDCVLLLYIPVFSVASTRKYNLIN